MTGGAWHVPRQDGVIGPHAGWWAGATPAPVPPMPLHRRPQHHRPSTYMPCDVHVERGGDGGVTVWCSEHEPMGRMKVRGLLLW